jgi:ferredoxin-thioredoxin reductase catalytic subunit
MLEQWHSNKRKYEAFSHWKVSSDKEVTTKLTSELAYHEVYEKGKLVCPVDKRSGSLK